MIRLLSSFSNGKKINETNPNTQNCSQIFQNKIKIPLGAPLTHLACSKNPWGTWGLGMRGIYCWNHCTPQGWRDTSVKPKKQMLR